MVPTRKASQLGVTPILVLGATGMLGQALIAEGKFRGLPMIGVARSNSDMNVDVDDAVGLERLLLEVRPEIVVNAVALTDLNTCESDPGRAYGANARCVGVLAEAARDCGAWLVQVSTDHYHSGAGRLAHDEYCAVSLVNEYARTKYAGEMFAMTCPGALVVRTNLVGFRERGAPTFVEWILGEFQQGKTIRAFEDYFVSSMSVRQFSASLIDLLPKRPSGVLNLAACEVFSKRDFIEALGARLFPMGGHVVPGSLRALGGVRRAESLGLDVTRAECLLGYSLPTLQMVVADLVAEYGERKSCATTV
jgi:dTDP-4-dehydrorhamnose reductase